MNRYEWEELALYKVADIIDPHPSHRAPDEVIEGIPFAGIGDLSENGTVKRNGVRIVSATIYDDHRKRYIITGNTIGFGRVASIGKVINFKNYHFPFTVSPTLALIEPNDIDRDFLLYSLKSQSLVTQIEKLLTGSTRSSLGIEILRKLILRVPVELNIQRKIARILSTIDGQIEKTEAIIAKYQAVKQGMLQDLFTRGIDIQTGQLRPRYEDAPDLYQDSPLGMIPKEWTFTTIGGILTLQRGVDITSKDFVKGNVPVFSSSGLQGYHNKSIANGPGVITGRKGTLGKVYYIDMPYWPHDTTLWVKDFKGNNAKFIYYFLQDMNLSKHDEATANPTLNRNNVHPLKTVFPLEYEEQRLIAKSISNHVDRINIETKSLSKLKLLKQGLMQDLLNGKVEVTA